MPAATTIRLEPQIQGALKTLSRATKRPVNKLVNEALASFVAQRNHAVATELESLASALRSYKADDAAATAAFVKGETSQPDPVEGRVVKGAKRPAAKATRKRARAAHA